MGSQLSLDLGLRDLRLKGLTGLLGLRGLAQPELVVTSRNALTRDLLGGRRASACLQRQLQRPATLAGSLTSAAQVESISQYACRSLLACPSHKASDLTLEGHCQTELHKSHGMGSALPFFATGFPLRKPQT